MNSKGQDLSYCCSKSIYIEKFFSYKDDNQKLKYDKKPRDVKFILASNLLYLFHKTSTK